MSKKKKSFTEQDEPEYKIGVSVRTEGEAPSEIGKKSKYGLEGDDEFYDLNFLQSAPDGVVEVKPATYSLMTWWKTRLGNQDTIDITNESNESILRFGSVYTGEDVDGGSLGKKDEVAVENIIEVKEPLMLVSLYSYMSSAVPKNIVEELSEELQKLNPKILYGSIELCTSDPSKKKVKHYLRYRVSTNLTGIKVGKVNAVENMIYLAKLNYGWVLDDICKKPKIKGWLCRQKAD